MNTPTRHDMLVELASDQVNMVQEMIYQQEYDDLHRWLQPIFLEILKLEFAEFSDEDLKIHYADQLGIDFSNAPNEEVPDETSKKPSQD